MWYLMLGERKTGGGKHQGGGKEESKGVVISDMGSGLPRAEALAGAPSQESILGPLALQPAAGLPQCGGLAGRGSGRCRLS